MSDADTVSGFFAVDRRTWAHVCGLGLNAAVAYLVLARYWKEQPGHSLVGASHRNIHRDFAEQSP
jgi:hypothetical protein